MSTVFEILNKDCAGRIGKLYTAHGVIETPTVLPVINPNIEFIAPSELKNYGAQALITNSYTIYRSSRLRNAAIDTGLHTLLGFNGPIMTDSGSFQLYLYNDVDVPSEQIVKFQSAIGSDIGVPLDIPTPPDVSFSRAEKELEITLQRLREMKDIDCGDMLLAGPVQGSTFTRLRKHAAEEVCKIGFDLCPIGAVVPLMESYRYRDLVDVIVSSKQGLSPCAPVHLFGAGHPMMFALAVALGCDLFDSAAYALYARDGRYMTSRGTYHIEDLHYLPCSCPVCSSCDVKDLKDDVKLIARHNLYAIFEEILLIKQCIKDGSLWELVEQRCRSHPSLLAGLKAAVKHSGWIERVDSMPKSTFFYCGSESAGRSEVLRYNRYIERFEFSGKVLIKERYEKMDADGFDYVLDFKPPFGAYPALLRESYPFNAEVNDYDYEALCVAVDNVIRLIQCNPGALFVFKKPSGMKKEFTQQLKLYAEIV
ncbi:MAG: 7-cyano-7-deazaguanine tRNA-ribosyltransferase [Candidatus Argoarchaeum ethanivorans]|uniref:tRNA-guanine(15) transglycosylase n=1 Tax=Candidatus Argoarchaeum ethanivorans TaxID=2608793 RepID=A0A8B3S057_9EURY|nr:MAG: 7-cyano-7-deazaguanine tRNA-ribosyltransferase [Candidatus Argoarchaeum ethanivorans]